MDCHIGKQTSREKGRAYRQGPPLAVVRTLDMMIHHFCQVLRLEGNNGVNACHERGDKNLHSLGNGIAWVCIYRLLMVVWFGDRRVPYLYTVISSTDLAVW